MDMVSHYISSRTIFSNSDTIINIFIVGDKTLSVKLVKLNNGELVYGEKEEIKEYCEQKETDVETWINYLPPSTVQSHFTYIGKRMCDPYSIARPIYKRDENGEYVRLTEFKEKW